jgi:hypothetical protein
MRAVGCIFFLIVIALLWGGGQGLYEGLRYREPRSIACEEALQAPPLSGWVHLTGCRVDGFHVVRKTHLGIPSDDLYVPVTSRDPAVKAVRIVLATKDPDLVAVVNEFSKEKDTKAQILFMVKNDKRLRRDKDITGMVQSGIDREDKLFRRLRELDRNIADDFVVIDEGRTPNLLRSGILFLAGVGLLVLGFVLGKKGPTPPPRGPQVRVPGGPSGAPRPPVPRPSR